VLARQGDDNLNTKGWIEGKSYLVSNDTRGWMMISRLDVTAGLPKKELAGPNVLQMAAREILPILTEALVGAVPTDYLGVHHQNCRRVHLEAGCFICPWCICGFGTLCVMTGQWRSSTVVPQGVATPFPQYEGKLRWYHLDVVVMTSQLEGSQATVDSLVEPGSKDTHWMNWCVQGEDASSVQRSMPVRMA
jgi:hypothetical protein